MSIYDNIKLEIMLKADEMAVERVEQLMDRLRAETPVRTGFLRASWYYEKEDIGKYNIINDAPYAIYVNNRTGFVERGLGREQVGGRFNL